MYTFPISTLSQSRTPSGIDMFFFLAWLSGQQVIDTGRAELPTHWIFIRPQISESHRNVLFHFFYQTSCHRDHIAASQCSNSPTLLFLSVFLTCFSRSFSLSPPPPPHSLFLNALSVFSSCFHTSTYLSPSLSSVLHESQVFG